MQDFDHYSSHFDDIQMQEYKHDFSHPNELNYDSDDYKDTPEYKHFKSEEQRLHDELMLRRNYAASPAHEPLFDPESKSSSVRHCCFLHLIFQVKLTLFHLISQVDGPMPRQVSQPLTVPSQAVMDTFLPDKNTGKYVASKTYRGLSMGDILVKIEDTPFTGIDARHMPSEFISTILKGSNARQLVHIEVNRPMSADNSPSRKQWYEHSNNDLMHQFTTKFAALSPTKACLESRKTEHPQTSPRSRKHTKKSRPMEDEANEIDEPYHPPLINSVTGGVECNLQNLDTLLCLVSMCAFKSN